MAVPTIPAILAALGLGAGLYATRDGTPAPRGTEVVPPRAPDVASGDAGDLPSIDIMRRIWQDNAAAPRPASPALTPASGLPTPPVPPEGGEGQAASEGSGETSQSTEMSQRQDGRTFWDRLADFGFAMAASRNPSLFGQMGDAGLVMRQGDQQARREALQARELNTMQEYRQNQIRLAEAEAAWQRDPNNPLNVARLAQARAAALRGASGGGSGGDRIAGQIVGDDGVLYGVTRDGRAIPYRTEGGEPFRRGQTENWQAQWAGVRNAAMARLSQPGSPGFALTPEQRAEAANNEADAAIARMRTTFGRNRPNTTEQPVETPRRPVYDVTGRPVQ